MDEDDFENARPEASDAAGIDNVTHTTAMHPVDGDSSSFAALRRRVTSDPSRTLGPHRENTDRPGIVWVRASDLLSTSSGRLAGRGLDFEAELARRLRPPPPRLATHSASAPTGSPHSPRSGDRASIHTSAATVSAGGDPCACC